MLILAGRFIFPGLALIMLFQTTDILDNWDTLGWIFPFQVFGIAMSLRVTYTAWFKDRLE